MNTATKRRSILWIVLVYCLLMPTMVWLGFWQLDKSFQRKWQLEAYEIAAQSTPEALQTGVVPRPFDRVIVRGQLDERRQILVDSIVRNGQNGFYVVSLLRLEDGGNLVVNRGWIPQTPTRQPIGDLSVPDGMVTFSGRVGKMPVGGLRLGDVNLDIKSWPAVLHYPTIEEVRNILAVKTPDWILLADGGPGEGMLREWEPGGLPPARHLGYAVQWFALSFALTILLLISFVKSRKKDD